MRALIASRDLMRTTSLGEDSYVNMLHVRPRHGKRNQIFRLARGRAGVTANATRVVDDLGPLHRAVLWFFEHYASVPLIFARANYITL
jgi:hypothetical protein